MSHPSSRPAVFRPASARLGTLFMLVATLSLAACGGGGSGDPASAPAPSAAPEPAPAPGPTPAPAPAPSPAPAPAPGTPGPLAALAGPADAFPHGAQPLAGTVTAGVSTTRNLISWDPTGNGPVLSLNHANGVQSQLQLPGGTFLEDTFITNSEITGLGSAFTSVVAAVQIAPGDLLTERQITATFVLPDTMMATLDLSQLVGFVADADGSNLHLAPIVPGRYGTVAARPAVKLDHLGIVGIAVATPQQQAALAAAWPSDPMDQLRAAVAPAATEQWRALVQPASAAAARRRPLADGGENPLLAPLRGYFNDAVVSAFAAAYGDPAQIPAAIQTGFNFLRQAELSGLSAAGGPLYDVAQDLQSRIDSLLDTYADHVASQCRGVGGAPQLQDTLATVRTLRLLGHASKATELEAVVPECSSFTVTFEHHFTSTHHTEYGGETNDVQEETLVKGSTTLGLNQAITSSPLRLEAATMTWTRARQGRTERTTWSPEPDTSSWAAFNLNVPLARTRSGVRTTSVETTLHAYGDGDAGLTPLQVTSTLVVTTDSGTSTQVTPDLAIYIPLQVPALPKIGPHNYGAIVFPASGLATTQATRTLPETGGTAVETEQVTMTIRRAE